MYDYSRYDTPDYQSGISDADIANFYLSHAGDDAALNAAMAQYGVSADRVAALTGWSSALAEPAPVWVPPAPPPPPPPAAVTVAAPPTVSDAAIVSFCQAHAGDDATIIAAMAQYGVSADRVTALTGWNSAQAEPAAQRVTLEQPPPAPAPPATVTVAAAPTVSDAAIVSFCQAHAGDDATIIAAMAQYGVSAERVTALTGWNPTPTPEQQRQQAMANYWDRYKSDPAKIYEGMQANNIGVNEVAKLLGVTPTEMANYLNSGRYAGSVRTGAGDNLDIHDIYKYEEVHREPQTRAEFEATVEPWMLDTNGRFKGPNDGVNYRWEGMTPSEVFQYWQPVPLDPSMARDGADGTQPQFCYLPGQAPYDPINLKWEPGYDNGGGVLGGVARAVGNLGTAVSKNPALMMAVTAGFINPYISTIGQSAGAGTALNTIGNILNAPGVMPGIMNFARTGDLGSSVVAGFSSWAGSVVSNEIADGIVGITGMPVDTARVFGSMTFTAISGADVLGVINSGASTINSIAMRTPAASTPGDTSIANDAVAALPPSQVAAMQPGTSSNTFNDANLIGDTGWDGYLIASNVDSWGVSTDNPPIDAQGRVHEPAFEDWYATSDGVLQYATQNSDGAVVITAKRDTTTDSETPSYQSLNLASGASGEFSLVDFNPPPSAASSSSLMTPFARTAAAILAAEIAYGPPQLKLLANATLFAGTGLAAWWATRNPDTALWSSALTPEERLWLEAPHINVPAPPLPPLPGFVPLPDSERQSPVLPGAGIDQPHGPTSTVSPIPEQLRVEDLIIERNNAEQRRFRNGLIDEAQRADPSFDAWGWEAHHIVPLNEYPELQPLRDKLQTWGVDLNNPVNGVLLPGRNAPGGAGGTDHADTQRNLDYRKAIEKAFEDVTNADEARFTLGRIKDQLRNGTFIKPKP